MPSIREYAAHYQIDSRRLGPRQLLMHPGPVNRGVELSPEVIDGPASLITAQVESGLVVRMAILYELLAGGEPRGSGDRARTPSCPRRPRSGSPPSGRCGPGRRRSPRSTGVAARASPRPTLILGGARVLDPRTGDRRAPRRRRPRRRDRRARRRRGGGPQRRCGARSTPTGCASFRPSSTRTSTCARPGARTRRTSRPARARRRRAASAGSSRWRTPSPPVDTAADVAVAARAGARAGRGPDRVRRLRHPRDGAATELTEMAELADAGAVGFSDDGMPIRSARVLRRALQYQRLAGAADRPARGGSRALGRRLDARGRAVSAGARDRRDPLDLGVDDDRPRRRDRRLRGRADPRPAPLGGRVGRRGRGGQGGRRADHLRGDAAPPDAHRRGGPQPRRALQDEPAAARRGRPPGADRRRCARARSIASRPTTRRTRATRRRSRSSRRRWA